MPELDPPGIVLDTSVAIHAVFPVERYHAESRDFLIRLAQQETRLYFNDLLWAELLEAAFKLALKERFGNEWRRRRMDGRARRRAKRLVDDAAAAWDEILSYFIWATLPLEQALERVPELMGDYGLGSYDAVHVATALALGLETIATTDHGFADVPAAALRLLVPRPMVGSCRRRRSRRRSMHA